MMFIFLQEIIGIFPYYTKIEKKKEIVIISCITTFHDLRKYYFIHAHVIAFCIKNSRQK